jgi:hypothetical protein
MKILSIPLLLREELMKLKLLAIKTVFLKKIQTLKRPIKRFLLSIITIVQQCPLEPFLKKLVKKKCSMNFTSVRPRSAICKMPKRDLKIEKALFSGKHISQRGSLVGQRHILTRN